MHAPNEPSGRHALQIDRGEQREREREREERGKDTNRASSIDKYKTMLFTVNVSLGLFEVQHTDPQHQSQLAYWH